MLTGYWTRGRRARWGRSGLRAIAQEVSNLRGDHPRVAVLAPRHSWELELIIGAFPPNFAVTLVEPGLPPWIEKARLAAAGPYCLIVDSTATEADDVDRFLRTFQHLRDGGVFLRPHFESPSRPSRPRLLPERLAELAADAGADPPSRRQVRLADSVGEIRRTDGAVSVVRKGTSMAMLREREMNEALRLNPARGRVLTERPGTDFESRSSVTRSSFYSGGFDTPASFTVPALYLREYDDVVCAPRGVVTQNNLFLPDTFRHHLNPVLLHRRLSPIGRGFATAGNPRPPTSLLDGTYFHLDNEHQGHFGHALTEQVSRLWGLADARRLYPDLKVLMGTRDDKPVPDWQLTLLAAAGIEPGDLALISRRSRVERLVAATPMLSMPAYIHPELLATWDEISLKLHQQAPRSDYPRRLFVTRTDRKRPCRNRLEVESMFAGFGFQIVHPERHSLPEQAAMFNEADVIGGFAGSGLFGTIFARNPKHLLMLVPSSYRASNEYLISSIRGHRISYAVCLSEIDQPETGKVGEAFNSGFSCDMTREGLWLRSVLEEL